MEWGAEIKVDGVRPAWLTDDSQLITYDLEDGRPIAEVPGFGPSKVGEFKFEYGNAIRLPATHFAYRALAAGFEPWGGGEAGPADWDGGIVLWRDGTVTEDDKDWKWGPTRTHDPSAPQPFDIIGYRKRWTTGPATFTAAHATDVSHVSIKRMTERQFIDILRTQGVEEWAKEIGLFREPTKAEAIAQKTGLTVDQVQSVLNEVSE